MREHICGSMLLFAASATAQTVTDDMLSGMSAMRKADHSTAEQAFTQAVVQAPEDARTWYYRAVNRLEAGDPQRALADLERVLQLDPKDVHGLLRRAEALEDLGRGIEARRELRKVLDIQFNGPAAEHALLQLGYHAMAEGDISQALMYYEQLIGIAPYDALAHFNHGTTLSLLDHDEQALSAFERALELDPTLDKALSGQGAVLLRMGRRQEACHALNAAYQAGNRSVQELLLIHCDRW